MDDYNPPKILFIKNVYLKDCIKMDDLFEQKLIDENTIDPSITGYEKYKLLPLFFTSLETWPTTTNINCWYCSLTFDTIPIFIPTSIEMSGSQLIFGREGCFCSFSCAKTYIDIYYSNIRHNVNKYNMLELLFKEIYGRKPRDIKPAPHHHTMLQYGGNLSAQEYRDKIHELTALI